MKTRDRFAALFALLLFAGGCQSVGCAEGLELVSTETYLTDAGPGARYQKAGSGSNTMNDGSGSWNWRDSSGGFSDPAWVCRAPRT